MNQQDSTSNLANQLAKLLDELSDMQSELLEVVSAKRIQLAGANVDGMRLLEPREQNLCDRFTRFYENRARLLDDTVEFEIPSDQARSDACSIPCAAHQYSPHEVDTATNRTRRLWRQNLVEWVLAQRSVLHAAQRLVAVATRRSKPSST